MLNEKFEFGERHCASCLGASIQSERPSGARHFAKLSAAVLLSVLFILPAERAVADAPAIAEPGGTFSVEATEFLVQEVLGRLRNPSGFAPNTPSALGEQIILAQTDVNAVCTSFRSGDAWKVLPPGGEGRSTCGPAFMTYRGGGYGVICKPSRQNVTDQQKQNAQDALEAFQTHCKCTTQCKP
jgi:hypothetical protein